MKYTQDELERLLEKWRKSRGETIRRFLGKSDVQRITLYDLFPGSEITLTSPFEYHKSWPNIVVQGPEFQLNFLYSYLEKLVRLKPQEQSRGWNGILRQTNRRIDLTYMHDDPALPALIELMEYRFMRDAMIYAKLKLSEIATLEIVREEKILLRQPIGLPEEIENGHIELPRIEFMH